jgi:hypothetical protein
MARGNCPESARTDFALFVDEFHNFATDSFASVLAEARKYRLSLTLSHQYLDQISPEIRSAVFGNVGNLLAFRVGHSDAKALAGEFEGEFAPAAFVDLPRFHAIAGIQVNGEPAAPFRVRITRSDQPGRGRPDRLLRFSRQRFASNRRTVEERIRRWLRLTGGGLRGGADFC